MRKGYLTDAVSAESMNSEDWQKARDGLAQEDSFADDAIVICGFTEFGRELYRVLDAAGAAENGGLVTFDLNPSRITAGWLAGVNAVYGDGASPNLLKATGVTRPKAVIVAYRSEAQRLEATARLREGLPPGTPIYARVVSGQSVGRDELLEAGATDVVSERTESALRFASLLNAFNAGFDVEKLRQKCMKTPPALLAPFLEKDPPGLPQGLLGDLADEFGCSLDDMVRLYEVFSSVPEEPGDQFTSVEELKDIFLRLAGDGPIDDETLQKWVELADFDKSGVLSFTDFARVYFNSKRASTEAQ